MIRIGLEATSFAKELALATTVFFGTMTTGKTGSTCVSGINDVQRNPCGFALVRQKLTKLCKSPRKPFVALSLSYRFLCSLPDSTQVFEAQCLLLNECFADEMTTNVVVGPPLVARLLLPDALQVPLGRLGTAGLKPLPKTLKTTATLLDACACVGFAVTVYGELNNAEVNAQNVLRVYGRSRRHIHCNVQEKRAVPQDEVSLSFGPVKTCRLVCTVAYRDEFAPHKAHERNLRQALKGHDARVVDHTAVPVKLDVNAPVALVGFHGFGNGAYRHLRRQAELGTKSAIDKRLQGNLVGKPLFVSNIGGILTT